MCNPESMHSPRMTSSLGFPLWITFFPPFFNFVFGNYYFCEWITFYDETKFVTELTLNWIFVHSQSDWSSVPCIHYTHIIRIFILSFCVSVFTCNGLSWYWQTLWSWFLGIVGHYCFLVLYFAFKFFGYILNWCLEIILGCGSPLFFLCFVLSLIWDEWYIKWRPNTDLPKPTIDKTNERTKNWQIERTISRQIDM